MPRKTDDPNEKQSTIYWHGPEEVKELGDIKADADQGLSEEQKWYIRLGCAAKGWFPGDYRIQDIWKILKGQKPDLDVAIEDLRHDLQFTKDPIKKLREFKRDLPLLRRHIEDKMQAVDILLLEEIENYEREAKEAREALKE